MPNVLRELIEAMILGSSLRVQMLHLPDGQRFWVKRAENLSLRFRLLKGDARQPFEAKRTALRFLAKRGLPVVEIAFDGPDYLVTPHVGRKLRDLVLEPAAGLEEVAAAFGQAGHALASLHNAGFAHGRPPLRDICWGGAKVRFIDLERFSSRCCAAHWQALDVIMFIQTMMSVRVAPVQPNVPHRIEVAKRASVESYRSTAPPAALRALRRASYLLLRASPLARALSLMRPMSREVAAPCATIAFLSSEFLLEGDL